MTQPRTDTLASVWEGIFAAYEASREKRGADWCRKYGVGGARRALERRIALSSVVPLKGPEAPALDTNPMFDALGRYAAECRRCAGCRLGRPERE